jgi:hypothetical protein
MITFKELEQMCGTGLAFTIADRYPNIGTLGAAMERCDPWLETHLSSDVRAKLRAKLGLPDDPPVFDAAASERSAAGRWLSVRVKHAGDFLCGGCPFGSTNPEPMYAGRCVLFAIMRAANTQGDYIRCSQCMNAEVAAYAKDGVGGGTDGPSYNDGRSEGRADVCADLRAILDPDDAHHWSKDGLIAAVVRLTQAVKEG